MKKYSGLLAVLLALAILSGCTQLAEPVQTLDLVESGITRTEPADSGLAPQPKDSPADDYQRLIEIPQPQPVRDYTILLYMNGSDLESRYKMATADLNEILASQFDSQKINVLILAGGTQKWHKGAIADGTTMIYQVVSGEIIPLADLGDANMMDKDLLSSYIDYGIQGFPARKYAFIFWDHGGGPMGGYGNNETDMPISMSIIDIEEGFRASGMSSTPFELIGFDCCLMGNFEIAYMLRHYGRYFVASEDTEPGNGWYYQFLADLSESPDMTGAELGTSIVDHYISFYRQARNTQPQTLATVDMGKLDNLSEAYQEFAAQAEGLILDDFSTISRARQRTKSYGKGRSVSYYDLIDLRHLAMNLQDNEQMGEAAAALMAAVDDAVVYNAYGVGMENSHGLTTYMPYDQKSKMFSFIEAYRQFNIVPRVLQFLGVYTQKLIRTPVDRPIRSILPQVDAQNEVFVYLDQETLDEVNEIYFTIWRQLEDDSDYFVCLGVSSEVEVEADGKITTMFDGYWASLGGVVACFYELENTGTLQSYTTPAILNGTEVDIIVVFDDDNPGGTVVGAIPCNVGDTELASKTLEPIRPGDRLQLQYYARLFLENPEDAADDEIELWYSSEEFTVDEDFRFAIEPVGEETYLYGFQVKDIYNNSYYTDFIEIRY